MLQVKNLRCGYPAFFLRNISFSIAKGQFVGIIGPNGSGKTTLLRALTRTLKPQEGSISLESKDLGEIDQRELARKIAVVSQHSNVSYIKVEDFVLMGRIPYYKRFQFFETRRDMEIVERCMELTDVSNYKDKWVGELSGGERQLCLIARALAQEPQLLLLDEPTSFLDISHQVKILDLIKQLNKKTSLTVILILHDLNLAGEYCDHLLLMKEGGIHEMGTPHKVLTYQTIEEVYQTPVVVGNSPVSERPFIFLVTEEAKQKARI